MSDMSDMSAVLEDGDAHAFAAKHEPDDAEFPILEPVDLGMGPGVEIQEGAAGDQLLPAPVATGEEERDVGDLLGQNVDGAVNPNNLLVGVGKDWTACGGVLAAEPGGCVGDRHLRFGSGA